MYIASDDLIGGRGDHYFLEPVCSFGSIRPSFNILVPMSFRASYGSIL